jgi:acyl-coenzyme A thioesterase 9
MRADPTYNTSVFPDTPAVRKVNFRPSSVFPIRVPELWTEAILHDAHTVSSKSPHSKKTLPRSDQLTPRNMHDSYCELVLPFGSSPKLLEQYTNVHGGIRTGK